MAALRLYLTRFATEWPIDTQPESWKAGSMKTTIDLPEELVREMKLRAARDGRKLKDIATEIFRRGLRREPDNASMLYQSRRLEQPLFVCEESEASSVNMSLEQLLELERKAEAEEDAQRARRPI